MKTYLVLSATHQHSDGKTYPKGSTITTAHDLIASFGEEKFQLVSDKAKLTTQVPAKAAPAKTEDAEPVVPAAPAISPQAAPDGAETEEDEAEEEPSSDKKLSHPDNTGRSKLGVDVTSNFPKAVDAEFKVWKGKGGWHYVTEPENPNKALNENALKADAVEAFIAEKIK